MKRLLTIITFALLSACSTVYKPVPKGYTGPTATIADSFRIVSISEVEFFYVEKFNGQDIENSRFESLSENVGRGMYLKPVPVDRAVPASKPVSISLVGRTEHGAPILALTNTVYQLKGTIEFTPEANKRYVVKGFLDEKRSSVWLEEVDTERVIGEKIKFEGPAKLGFFDK